MTNSSLKALRTFNEWARFDSPVQAAIGLGRFDEYFSIAHGNAMPLPTSSDIKQLEASYAGGKLLVQACFLAGDLRHDPDRWNSFSDRTKINAPPSRGWQPSPPVVITPEEFILKSLVAGHDLATDDWIGIVQSVLRGQHPETHQRFRTEYVRFVLSKVVLKGDVAQTFAAVFSRRLAVLTAQPSDQENQKQVEQILKALLFYPPMAALTLQHLQVNFSEDAVAACSWMLSHRGLQKNESVKNELECLFRLDRELEETPSLQKHFRIGFEKAFAKRKYEERSWSTFLEQIHLVSKHPELRSKLRGALNLSLVESFLEEAPNNKSAYETMKALSALHVLCSAEPDPKVRKTLFSGAHKVVSKFIEDIFQKAGSCTIGNLEDALENANATLMLSALRRISYQNGAQAVFDGAVDKLRTQAVSPPTRHRRP